MQGDITIEQIRAEYVDRMGRELGSLCCDLRDDVDWLRHKWGEFLELFGKGPERIELLNKVASNFFYILNQLLFEDAMLHLRRLTDPPVSRSQENLTLLSLAELIADQQFSAQVRKEAEEVKEKCKFARMWCNKRLAHADLMTLRDKCAPPLPAVTSQDIDSALGSIHALLNTVEQHYGVALCALGHDPFAAKSLVRFLEKAIQAEERQDRPRQGDHT